MLKKSFLRKLCETPEFIDRKTLLSVLELSIEIAREGREGRKIGTMFVVGDERNVRKRSRSLILDPLEGHTRKLKNIHNPNMRETIKELAQLDGAFIVSNDGTVLSATNYIDASQKDLQITMGLGARHVAAASISKETRAVAIVVSESGIVRIFDDGELVGEILPEEWLLSRERLHVTKPCLTEKKNSLAIITKKDKANTSR